MKKCLCSRSWPTRWPPSVLRHALTSRGARPLYRQRALVLASCSKMHRLQLLSRTGPYAATCTCALSRRTFATSATAIAAIQPRPSARNWSPIRCGVRCVPPPGCLPPAHLYAPYRTVAHRHRQPVSLPCRVHAEARVVGFGRSLSFALSILARRRLAVWHALPMRVCSACTWSASSNGTNPCASISRSCVSLSMSAHSTTVVAAISRYRTLAAPLPSVV